MAIPPIVALEIGTSKIVAMVGELRDDGNLVISGIGEHESRGVRKGEIVDLEGAAFCLRSAITAADATSGVDIFQAYLAIAGGHIRSTVNSGNVPVLDPEGVITDEDIQQVMQLARALNLPEDRETIHTICQHYSVDDQGYVMNPDGMVGSRLGLNMLVVHGVRNLLRNTVRVVRSIGVEVMDVSFSGLCAALSVLTPEQKQSGVILIDLGGGTTDYVAYARGVVAGVGSIGVGGDHISNDVARAFNIDNSRAEILKREHGRAVTQPSRAPETVLLPSEVGFASRAVRLDSLDLVINARIDETLRIIRKQLDDDVTLAHTVAGVVLTGGGARLNGVTELAESIFDMPCSIGKPRNVSGLSAAVEGPEYAVCCGLIQQGFKDAGKKTPLPLTRWLKSLLLKRGDKQE